MLAPLVKRGLLAGSKDPSLHTEFPFGKTERMFSRLWAPSTLGTLVEPPAALTFLAR